MCEYCEPNKEGLTYCLDSAGWEYLEECYANVVQNSDGVFVLRFTLKASISYKEVDLEFDFKINNCPMCGRTLNNKDIVNDRCDYCEPVKEFTLAGFSMPIDGEGIIILYDKMPKCRYLGGIEAYYKDNYLCFDIEETMFNQSSRAVFKFEIYHCPQCGKELGSTYEI